MTLLAPSVILEPDTQYKDATTLLGYVFVVVVVNQLGTQRQRLADLAARERDELASEIHLAAEVQQSILPRSVPTVLDLTARRECTLLRQWRGITTDSLSFPPARSPW
jgi:hypothetical protein